MESKNSSTTSGQRDRSALPAIFYFTTVPASCLISFSHVYFTPSSFNSVTALSNVRASFEVKLKLSSAVLGQTFERHIQSQNTDRGVNIALH